MSDFAPDRSEFYLGNPEAHFRRLRDEDPVHWYEEGGFWCITRHADLQYVSSRPRLFCSSRGTQIFQIATQGGAPQLETTVIAPSIIQMDPPKHNRHRKLAIQAFTPRHIGELEARIREIAVESLERVPRGEPVDFIEAVAVPLPMFVIAEMLGVPREDHADFRRWSDAMVVAGGGEGFSESTQAALAELFAYLQKTVDERRRAPRDDLISLLLAAELDGEHLDDGEILMFAMTLLVAGNETTRNLISGGSLALLEHPDQKQLLRRDPSLIPNAVEEMLRWVSPVRTFCRSATQPTELHGKRIEEGQYLLLLYGSANRDEAVFGDDADRFDVTRENGRRHVAFGYGEHLCMGASLARLEARVMFEELLGRLPEFELAGAVRPLPSSLMNGIVEMPVTFKG